MEAMPNIPVSLKSVLITSTIEAFEGREVAVVSVVDVRGAFISASMDEEVIMSLQGCLDALMTKMAPDIYIIYITIDSNTQPVPYVKLHKSLCGYICSALLFYKKFVEDLELKNFELNPYDPCITNKLIGGTQFIVVWHVDDIKMPHSDPEELTKMIKWLKSIYGKIYMYQEACDPEFLQQWIG
jgi:hypothetical protein